MPPLDPAILARRSEIVAALRAIVPGEGVIDDLAGMRPYECDALSAYRQMPLVVVLPVTVDQVSAILRYCQDTKGKVVPTRPAFVPRAVANLDDDDVLMAHGGGGTGFGRCGGRLLSSKLEQDLCNRLGMAGVVHSHSPRHYEIRFENNKVAAYAPMIVLRGRGREGKGVVIEAVEEANAPILRKIVSFRAQYGQEFYVILVGTDEVLDEAPLAAHDESCSAINVNTLIARLAE